jgi:terminase small subunit-like protein
MFYFCSNFKLPRGYLAAMPSPPLTPARDWPIPAMDHESGHKDTAFTWAMGRLILQRMGDRETMKAITADPRMPAYCTVFQWVKVVPEFGDAYREVRATLAKIERKERDERRALLVRMRNANRRAAGKRVRTWVAGRKSSYTPELAGAVCWAIEEGASLSEVVSRPGMPSFKAVYGWMRRFPEFRAQYIEACRLREVGLWIERDMVIDRAMDMGLAFDPRQGNAEIAAIEGRIGRLTPKIYRGEVVPRP